MLRRAYANCCNYVSQSVHSWDSFSQPIVFTHKGKDKFSTFLGGVCSLFILLILSAYGYSLMMIMIHRRGTNKSMSTTVVDLSDNPAVHYPGLKNFSFAMAVTHRLGYPIEANSSYLEFEVSQVSVDTTTGSNYTSVFTRLNMRL